MASYKYREQKSGGSNIAGSSNTTLYSLDITSINSNKVTDYEFKFVVQDKTFNKYSFGYFRGEVINDKNINPSSYTTDQDTSFVNVQSTASVFISNTVTDIYDTGSQTFNFNITNNDANSVAYDYFISIEINFII